MALTIVAAAVMMLHLVWNYVMGPLSCGTEGEAVPFYLGVEGTVLCGMMILVATILLLVSLRCITHSLSDFASSESIIEESWEKAAEEMPDDAIRELLQEEDDPAN